MANKFKYFAGEQGSPEWFKLRLGKVTASRLSDWLATSKRDGSPLKARKDYETEITFELTFGVNFENYVTQAMREGIEYEPFVREQYAKIKDVKVEQCGAWYRDDFVASPDGVIGDDGLLEIKVVRENTFTDILANGIPEKWMLQIQGQLWASGRKWCDFAAANLLTKKIKIIRVNANSVIQDRIAESLDTEGPLEYSLLDVTDVFDFEDQAPALEVQDTPKLDVGF